jgi:hypothetical protein
MVSETVKLERVGYMLQIRTSLGWADAWPTDVSDDREKILALVQEANEGREEPRWRAVERLERVIS